jgi:hypothetical protein
LLVLLPLYALAHVVSQWLLGRLLLGPTRSRALTFLVGWAILTVVAQIPFLGGLVDLAAIVVGLGGMAVASWRARRPGVPEAPPPPAPGSSRPAVPPAPST